MVNYFTFFLYKIGMLLKASNYVIQIKSTNIKANKTFIVWHVFEAVLRNFPHPIFQLMDQFS